MYGCLPAVEDNTKLLIDLKAKAMARRQVLYERGELLGEAQMCERLGIDEAALRNAVREGRMFWIEGARGEAWYPVFFVDSAANRRDIERVALALNQIPGGSQWRFFTTPKYSLGGRTPLDALFDGALSSVLQTAHEFVERNFGRHGP